LDNGALSKAVSGSSIGLNRRKHPNILEPNQAPASVSSSQSRRTNWKDRSVERGDGHLLISAYESSLVGDSPAAAPAPITPKIEIAGRGCDLFGHSVASDQNNFINPSTEL
jgi:hypothetical protein